MNYSSLYYSANAFSSMFFFFQYGFLCPITIQLLFHRNGTKARGNFTFRTVQCLRNKAKAPSLYSSWKIRVERTHICVLLCHIVQEVSCCGCSDTERDAADELVYSSSSLYME